jgi:hypothetical protein
VSVEGGGESSGRFGAEQGGSCVEELEEGGHRGSSVEQREKGREEGSGDLARRVAKQQEEGVRSGTCARERGLAAGSYA